MRNIKKRVFALVSLVVFTFSILLFPSNAQISAKPTATAETIDNSDYMLLARIISAEARGEPYEGQVAVGAVILNRIEHPSFPDTMSGVIYQPLAFSCVDDGQIYEPVADSAYKAATDALNGWDPLRWRYLLL